MFKKFLNNNKYSEEELIKELKNRGAKSINIEW